MIWEQRVQTIAMLTKLKEGGREKVFQYWPDDIGASRTFDEIEVSMIAALDERDYVMRTFSLQHIPTGKAREVRHIQYLAWPDHGVPMESYSFLAYAKEVRKAHREGAPLVVHCSAGIGRAGTFIVADAQMRAFDDQGVIDIGKGG